MRAAVPFVFVLAACRSDPPRPVSIVLPSSSLQPAANSAAAPALPSRVTVCEPAQGHHGAWRPSVDEVVAAAEVLPSPCFDPKDRAPAIRACAARLGTATVKVGAGTLDEGATCEESFQPATWNGRRWIVLFVSSFSGATATGSAFAAELHGATAVPYLDHEGLVADCKSAATAPKGAPPEWAKLPADLARFLCGY